MKMKYEYTVINKDGFIEDMCYTREDARNSKRYLKEEYSADCKIVQRVYKLETEREIR